jgi:hypothetical protein
MTLIMISITQGVIVASHWWENILVLSIRSLDPTSVFTIVAKNQPNKSAFFYGMDFYC